MKAERWRQIEDLLDIALEREPAERALLLERACAGDTELRREVESLLAHETASENFIEAPAFALAADLLADDAVEQIENRRFGAYRILREIGRGGMGAVFLAERSDGEFQQKVALKLVRRGFADADLTRRFRRERQILASLNHPNIARLLDGGVSADGEPFLVMEHVEGVRIDDYSDAENLSTRERLRLFLSVCRGVSYAHQHLVVHRDIKPSNILVTADGTPKLLDFGIAKLLDPERAGDDTRTEMRAFTPDYAAPEQMRGAPVTTASDVYSLGVLLDDLLRRSRTSTNAARAPGGWLSRSVGRTVATNLPTEDEGRKVRSKSFTQTFVNPELKNIVAMARREDPARRYASVAQFAEDVQRYLDYLPVRAQKDSFAYRAGKFIRRNKVSVGAALVVVLTLVASFGLALSQANVARRERDRAERRFNDVRQLANTMLTEIAPKIERLQGSTEARRTLIFQSLKYLDSLAQEVGDDTQLQLELAAAYEKIGDIQGNPAKPNLSDFAGAISSYEKANRMRRNLPPTRDNQLLLASNFRELGNIRHFQQNDFEGTQREYAEALKIQESLLTQEPESYELQMEYLKTKFEIAKTHTYYNQYSVAASILREVIDTLQRLDQNKPETQRLLAAAYADLGTALSWDDKQPEAENEMAKATAIADRLAAEQANDTNIRYRIFKIYMLASGIYEGINDETSLQFAHKALRMGQQAAAADAADVQAKHYLAKSFSQAGGISVNLKRFPEAISNLKEAEKIHLDLLERDPKNPGYRHDLGKLYTHVGWTKHEQGDLRGSLEAFQKSANYFEMNVRADEKNAQDRRSLAQALKTVGLVSLKLGERGKARENFQQASDILHQLKAQNALGNWDNKLFEEVQAALQSL